MRRGGTARDMTYSMIALLVPIALMVVLYRFLGGESPTVVNAAATYADAQSRAHWQVLQPRPVPAGWKATSAATAPENGSLTLRVGYIGPSGAFVQVTESGAPSDGVVNEALGGTPRPAGSTRIGGRDWQQYTGAHGERALVLLEPKRTAVLAGRAADAQLAAFAAALQS